MLIFLPKINIISFPGRETAGIRIDDIILLLFSILLFWGHISTSHKTTKIERNLFVIVSFAIFSYFSNRILVKFEWLHVDANILYSLRILEYFLFFYVGYYASRSFSMVRIVSYYFVMNATLMVLQRAGLIGYWGLYGYEPTCTYRCAGIASFPSEMGMLLNLMFCCLLYNKDEVLSPIKKFFYRETLTFLVIDRFYPFALFFITSLLLIINGSRISFIANGFVFFLYLITKVKNRIFLISLSSILALVGAVFLGDSSSLKNSTLIARSETLFSMKNIDLIQKVWDNIDTNDDPIGKEAVRHNSTKEDTSWWMRIHKWLYALKIYVNHPEAYLQGIGPGFAMAALDGGILRIFVEYGLVGFLLFFALFYRIGATSEALKYCMVTFLINMIFIDVYLAYKPMALLFFITGYYQVKKTLTDLPKNSQKKFMVCKCLDHYPKSRNELGAIEAVN